MITGRSWPIRSGDGNNMKKFPAFFELLARWLRDRCSFDPFTLCSPIQLFLVDCEHEEILRSPVLNVGRYLQAFSDRIPNLEGSCLIPDQSHTN